MFGNCILLDYILSTSLILSNSLTIYFIYPIIADYLRTYVQESELYKLGLYTGVL